jgi:hypothetical protein
LDFPPDLNPLLARSIGYQGKGPIPYGLDEKNLWIAAVLREEGKKYFRTIESATNRFPGFGGGVNIFLQPLLDALIYLIPNFPKFLDFCLITPGTDRRILKRPTYFLDCSEEGYGTVFFLAITEDKEIAGRNSTQDLFDLDGNAVGQFDPRFRHHLPSIGMNFGTVITGTDNIKTMGTVFIKKCRGHWSPRGIIVT